MSRNCWTPLSVLNLGLSMDFDLEFCTLLDYVPKSRFLSASDEIRRSQLLNGLKKATPLYRDNLASAISSFPDVKTYLSGGYLVPVPGSNKYLPDSVKPMELFGDSIAHLSLGVLNIFKRIQAVKKSAFFKHAVERPSTFEHAASLEVEISPLFYPRKLILLDDILTTGRTVCGAALAIRKVNPEIEISVFCIARNTDRFRSDGSLRNPRFGKMRMLPDGNVQFPLEVFLK